MYNTRINTLEGELYYNGKIILIYSIEYPEIVVTINKIGNPQEEFLKVKLYNHYFRKQVIYLKKLIEYKIYNKVKENYIYCKNNNINFKPYKVIVDCNSAEYMENKLMNINFNIELK